MAKRKKSNILDFKLPFFFVALVAFVFFMADMVFFEDSLKDGRVLGASNKNNSTQSNKEGKENGNNGKKLESNIPSSPKAQSHAIKVKEIVLGLEEVALEEVETGDEEVGNEIGDVAEDIEEVALDTTESMDEIEDRPAWKTFLLGTDYKNLGQLRSSIVHTDNSIRKITQTMARVEGADSDTALQERLGELNQERTRIMEMIKSEEDKFSLFGWLSKLISGYTAETPNTEI